MDKNTEQLNKFKEALTFNASAYGVALNEKLIQRLANYYELLNTWNPRLHLVAPCSAAEFAQRHILESLLLLKYLPLHSRVVDIGSGAGLPIIPCLAARADLNAVMIESSKRKAVFLREVLSLTGTSTSAKVITARFEDVPPPPVEFVTSRALDRFIETLPRLIEWSPQPSTLLLFGGPGLRNALANQGPGFEETSVPNSERRFLFVVERDQ